MDVRIEKTVMVLVLNGNSVLLYRRINTWFEENKFALPGGLVDGAETPEDAAVRETYEETGLTVPVEMLRFVTKTQTEAQGRRFENHYFYTTAWSGEVTNKEPDRCSDLGWYPLDALPSDTSQVVTELVRKLPV